MPDNNPWLKGELVKNLGEMQIALEDHQHNALVDYLELLSKWNRVYNLTAIKGTHEMLHRHVLDSLSILPYVTGNSLIDVGSGAGLPGIPLAICRPQMQTTLVDTVSKKTRFMQQAIGALKLTNVTACHARVQEVQLQSDMVTARAFAAPEKLALLSRHLLEPGGRLLAMVATLPALEQKISGFSLQTTAKLTIPGETAERNIVIWERDKD